MCLNVKTYLFADKNKINYFEKLIYNYFDFDHSSENKNIIVKYFYAIAGLFALIAFVLFLRNDIMKKNIIKSDHWSV